MGGVRVSLSGIEIVTACLLLPRCQAQAHVRKPLWWLYKVLCMCTATEETARYWCLCRGDDVWGGGEGFEFGRVRLALFDRWALALLDAHVQLFCRQDPSWT